VVIDPAMRRLYELATRVARGTISVLVVGETGTGKEVLAELIHTHSPRAAGPLVRINCAAFAETLIESELFGHEKGAFTGAQRERAGLLEAADGGTVVLDEVGETTPAIQAKLLRVLEERAVLRVGASTPRPIDVRFVAATNRDLEGEIETGRFRRDLYFRLAGVVLAIPPLRDRPDDLVALAERFAAEAAARIDRPPPRLSPGALAALRAHPWPGNVRELRNVIERAVLLADGDELTAEHLPFAAAAPATGSTPDPAALPSALAALERQRIVEALEAAHGNQTRAAAALGMPLRTLVKRLDQYNLPRPRKR
jgi:transcriptional regulator with PAS, ATPase and Fis domain